MGGMKRKMERFDVPFAFRNADEVWLACKRKKKREVY